MDAGPEDADWVFRAGFSLRDAEELRAKRAVLQASSRTVSEVLRRNVFGLPLSLCISLGMAGAVAWYFLQDKTLGKAISGSATTALLVLVSVEILCLGLCYAIFRSIGFKRRRDLSEKLEGERRVSFEADAKGYLWEAPGALLEGKWSEVDAIWNGKTGLAVVRGADVAFVPKHVFPTEAAFVSTIDTMLRLASSNDPIRIDA